MRVNSGRGLGSPHPSSFWPPAPRPGHTGTRGLALVGQNGAMTTPAGQRRVVLLGSTGSIGTQALDVIGNAGEQFRVTAICAGGSNVRQLAEQALRWEVDYVGVSAPAAAQELRERRASGCPAGRTPPQVVAGPDATAELATLDCDVVLNGVAGAQGLRATLAALQAGRTVALANKEALIAGGPLALAAAAAGQLVPVDSEHSALAQCLRSGTAAEVRRLVLTASGGPFRGRRRADLENVTPEQALAHPTWAMGPLITTNSATLVNKGLELIEARLLFGVGYDRIDVVVHPQSMVHSMVEFRDGATVAQLSAPDMRLPIAYALAFPARATVPFGGLDWAAVGALSFERPDLHAFPCLAIA